MPGPFPPHVTCAIAGGGPAGVMLGFLLARAGVEVLVLEKHRDFLRDFRGDTIHASTLTLLDELGLGEEFARLRHRRGRAHAGGLPAAAGRAPGDRIPAAVGLPGLRDPARRRAADIPAAAGG